MSEIEEVTLYINNGLDISFKGRLLESVGFYSILSLYETIGGAFVCHRVSMNLRDFQQESSTSEGAFYLNLEQIKEFFGYSVLAKELYAKVGLSCTVFVD